MSEKSELLKLHEDIEYKKDELKNLQHQAVSNKSEELEEKIKELEIEIKEMEEKKKILLSQTKTIKKKQQSL